ncbi:MAG: TetR/AcrR family transcriptional regulator [Anaerolineae bacterium]|nr:TetR/AcrR family transcriptional regulator [Anaerolineae bacterium]
MSHKKAEERRERRAAARRNQILDAAAEVFAEKGFARATTKEIADRADISEGTIYNYFQAKEDLLIDIVGRLAESQSLALVIKPDMIEQVLAVPPRDFLNAMFHMRHAFVLENNHLPMLQAVTAEVLVNQEFAARYYRELLEPAMGVLAQHLQARIARGEVRPVDAPLVARFLFAFELGLLGFYVLGDPLIQAEWQSDTLLEAMVDFFLNGLGDVSAGQG